MNPSEQEQLKRRNRELSVLNEIAQALNKEVDLDRALNTTLALVADLCGMQTGWIWLIHEETEDPYLAVVHNLPPALTAKPEIMDGRAYCHCLDSYQSGDMEGAENISIITCTRLKGRVDASRGLRYHASIPLYAKDKQLGILNVASAEWAILSNEDLALLHTVGDLLSIAIERARLFDQNTHLAIMEERNRLAREIHDTLAQGLAALSLQLETADALLDKSGDDNQVHDIIHRALDLTRSNLDAARRSVLDLRAAPLEGRTLADALDLLAQSHASTSSIHIEFEVNENRPLPSRVEAGIFRVAQEALNNVQKHASAKNVNVRLNTSHTQLELIIEDDGCGFDPNHVAENTFGLVGISERVRLLGGTFEISSSPGSGTQIEIKVPLGENA